MFIFDIETEENLQCGVTSNPGAKSSSGGSNGSKRASASAAGAVIKELQGQGQAARAAGVNAKAAGKIIRAEQAAGAAVTTTATAKTLRTSKSERIERANNTMGVQAGRASRQESAASLAIKKARAEGNESEVKKQQDKYNKAVFRGYQIGKRSRQIARIASPD